jgi:hypothetical protein
LLAVFTFTYNIIRFQAQNFESLALFGPVGSRGKKQMTATQTIRGVLKPAKACRLNLTVWVLCTLVLSFGLALGQRTNQSPPTTPAEAKQLTLRLEQSIPLLMEKGDIPGLSIAVIGDATVIWSRGFGVKNSETKKAV